MSHWDDLKQLLELQNKHQVLAADWLKHLLTLATGALAVLSGLRPAAAAGLESYLLAGTWLFLGTGIVFGASATFLQVHHTRRLAARFRDEMLRNIQEDRPALSEPVIVNPNIFFSCSPPLMVGSLLLAVCCLVGFSVSAALA